MGAILRAAEESALDRSRRGWGAWILLAALLLLWAWIAWPLVAGERTLFLRDVFTSHLPLKAFGAQQLAAGSIPALNPIWALGQPFRGNPNALAFYPDNLLYLVLPFWSALNLHYLLHWLLAFFAMRALARELGQSEEAALLAGITYAGSGWCLSLLTFYNLLTVAAWWPLVLWGAARGGRRGIALGGIACGLALLGGEPVSATLGLVPLLLLAAERHGLRRGVATAVGIGGAGLLVALPQVVATARVLDFSVRAVYGLPPEQAKNYALHPLRLLELLLPLPFGWPAEVGKFAYWSPEITPSVPYHYSLYLGIVGLALALAASRRHLRWTALAGISLLLGWLGGFSGEAVLAVGAGIFRYPEKLLFWLVLAAALLSGWGLDRVIAAGRRFALGAAVVAVLLVTLALGLALRFSQAAAWLALHLQAGSAPGTDKTQVALAIAGLHVAALLLALAAWSVRRGWRTAILLLQAVGLLQLAPLVTTDEVAPFAQSPVWADLLPDGAGVATSESVFPPWEARAAYSFGIRNMAWRARVAAADLEPAPGVLHGLRYPLAPDLEGIYSPLSATLLRGLQVADWPTRILWLRLLGVHGWVSSDARTDLPLPVMAEEDRFLVRTRLYEIPDPAPAAFWPERVVVVERPIDAVGVVGGFADPVSTVVVPAPIEHHPGGEVSLRVSAPDRLEFEVDSAGGLVVLQRAYQKLFRAEIQGSELPTLPVDLCLLGVVVPPGQHRVVISVSSWPEISAGVVALIAAFALLFVAWRRS